MENKKIMLGLILLLAACNVILLVRERKNRTEVTPAIPIAPQEPDNRNRNLLLQQYSESEPCGELLMKDAQTKSDINFKDLLSKREAVLFFRFKENTCDVCIRGALEILKRYSGLFPEGGIVILSGYRNVRQFYAFFQSSGIGFRLLNLDRLPLAAEEQEEPYFFIVTPEMKIQNVFIVSKDVNSLTGEYLHGMGHKYWAAHLHEQGHIHESDHDHEHD